MPSCQDTPLVTSIEDIKNWQNQKCTIMCKRCCEIMGIHFSPCYDGYTGLELGHHVASLIVLGQVSIVHQNVLAATATFFYIIIQCLTRDSASAHITQAALGIAVAVDCAHCCTVEVWLAMLATVLHLGMAMVVHEINLMGDCRRCLKEARHCRCGKLKRPLPPGALAHLVQLIEAQWLRRLSASRKGHFDSHCC